MFKLFKKTNLQTDGENLQTPTSAIPSAKDALEKASKKWKYITRKEIIEEINYASSKGKKYVIFFDSYISEEIQNELLSLGYKVNVKANRLYSGPLFEITW